jgi:hypothetical protein
MSALAKYIAKDKGVSKEKAGKMITESKEPGEPKGGDADDGKKSKIMPKMMKKGGKSKMSQSTQDIKKHLGI